MEMRNEVPNLRSKFISSGMVESERGRLSRRAASPSSNQGVEGIPLEIKAMMSLSAATLEPGWWSMMMPIMPRAKLACTLPSVSTNSSRPLWLWSNHWYAASAPWSL